VRDFNSVLIDTDIRRNHYQISVTDEPEIKARFLE